MKIKATESEVATLAGLLGKWEVGGKLFSRERDNPKFNAQVNLCGRTHYVDDETLRFHFSKVLSSGHHAGGLLFRVVESCAADMHNQRRAFRVVWFDIYGTVINRPSLEEAKANRRAAEKADEALAEFDLVAHYREALTERLNRAQREVAAMGEALAKFPEVKP